MIVVRALKTLTRFCRDERAVTAIEYAMIAVLVGVVVIVSASSIGPVLNSKFNSVASELAGDTDEPPAP